MYRCLLVAVLLAVSHGQTPRRLGQYSQSKPSTLGWYRTTNVTDQRDTLGLMADTENNVPLTNDQTYIYRSPGRFINNPGQLRRHQIAGGFNSPRNIGQAPDNALGEPIVTINDGTDASNKRRGSVHVVRVANWDNTISNQIAGNILLNPQLSYRSTHWFHSNADPFMDAFTCRREYDNPLKSEMLILLQPIVAPYVRHWDEVSIHNDSCDTFLQRVILSAQVGPVRRNFDVLFSSGYYSRQFMMTWTNQQTGLWGDPDQIQHRILATGRRFNDIQGADLNNDGIPEILVSIKDTNGGGLEIYEVPADFRTGQFRSHTVISGLSGRGDGAGGQIRVFRPVTSDTSSKPWIAFAGAENGRAYYLRPNSQDPAVFTYDVLEFAVNTGLQGFVSGIETADVDFDGYTEVFISSHGQDAIQVWTFRP